MLMPRRVIKMFIDNTIRVFYFSVESKSKCVQCKSCATESILPLTAQLSIYSVVLVLSFNLVFSKSSLSLLIRGLFPVSFSINTLFCEKSAGWSATPNALITVRRQTERGCASPSRLHSGRTAFSKTRRLAWGDRRRWRFSIAKWS